MFCFPEGRERGKEVNNIETERRENTEGEAT